mgnify:CR=1 FL=1
MKRFTKVCMITALVTFIIGVLLFGVGALFGGLRQLEHISVRAVTGIPFCFVRDNGIFSFGFFDEHWDDEWEEYWDWESQEWEEITAMEALEDLEEAADPETMEDLEELEDADDAMDGVVTGQATGLTVDTLRGLDLEVGACRMYVKETDEQNVSIAIIGECEDHYRYRIKDEDTLLLVHKDMDYNGFDSLWNSRHPRGNTRVYLYLPKGAMLDDISIDFGAGKLDAGYLKAKEIEISAGAGKCTFDGLEASESIELSMGAGKITAGTLFAKEAKLDIAAGELHVSDAKVTAHTEAVVSMGNANLNGSFAGELNADCSMGNLNFTLEGAEDDYNYDVDCGMGNVKIGSKRYNNLGGEFETDHGSSSTVSISCAMGTVNVDFTE